MLHICSLLTMHLLFLENFSTCYDYKASTSCHFRVEECNCICFRVSLSCKVDLRHRRELFKKLINELPRNITILGGIWSEHYFLLVAGFRVEDRQPPFLFFLNSLFKLNLVNKDCIISVRGRT